MLAWAQQQAPQFKSLLRKMVECESPSDYPEGVNGFGQLVAETVSSEASVQLVAGGRWGRHLMCRWGRAKRNSKQVLVLAHGDTVWPRGTLETMPFRESNGRLWGPGVLDMKGGVAVFLFAMQAAHDLNLPVPDTVLLQVNSEEEVGSPSSRPLTEANAARSGAVLVLEPGTGLEGKLKTERKGVGGFRMQVRGRASHAGVDFEQGASAILELAGQLGRVAAFTDLKRGITINPGVIGGGTKSNVIAAEAWADIDFRVKRLQDAAQLEKKFSRLRPINQSCSLHIEGGLNRPPMETSAGGRKLFRLASESASELGLVVEQSSTGGGSDGNFTAALGVPTLDGLGCVGEGAHARTESILLREVPNRIALLATLLGRLKDFS